MDLYYSLTKYHLLSMILHKIIYGKNSDSVIYISNLMQNYENVIGNIKKTELFKEVIMFPDKDILNERRRIIGTVSDVAKKIECSYDVTCSKVSNLDKFDNYFLCGDHFPLGIYLNYLGKKYSYFEDGDGQQSVAEMTIEHAIKEKDPFLYPIVVELGLFGRNDNVINRYIDMRSQREGYEDDKAIDFCISDILRTKLSKKNKSDLRIIFDFVQPKITAENSIIFLPQHNVNLGVFTCEQQLYQSSLLLDYFADGYKKYIKPHPSDIFTDYSAFDDVTILDGNYPVELLSLAVNGKFAKGITAWSTSINSLAASLESKVSFTSDIDKNYKLMHRYYAAARLIKEYAVKHRVSHVNILDIGTDNAMLAEFFENCDDLKFDCSFKLYNDAEEYNSLPLTDSLCVCVCDKSELIDNDSVMNIIKNSDRTEFTVFIDSSNDSIFINNAELENFEKISVIEINKKSIAELLCTDDKDEESERIYVYMSDTADRETIEAFSFTKKLALTKMLIEANNYKTSISDEYVKVIYREVKTLEGILSATERRVIAEAEKNTKLIEEHEKDKLYISELEEKVDNLTAIVEATDIDVMLEKLNEYVENNEIQLKELEEITANQEKIIIQRKRMQELNERIKNKNYTIPVDEANSTFSEEPINDDGYQNSKL